MAMTHVIMLKTKCGCTKMVPRTYPKPPPDRNYEGERYRVPFMVDSAQGWDDPSKLDHTASLVKYREFEFRGQHFGNERMTTWVYEEILEGA